MRSIFYLFKNVSPTVFKVDNLLNDIDDISIFLILPMKNLIFSAKNNHFYLKIFINVTMPKRIVAFSLHVLCIRGFVICDAGEQSNNAKAFLLLRFPWLKVCRSGPFFYFEKKSADTNSLKTGVILRACLSYKLQF